MSELKSTRISGSIQELEAEECVKLLVFDSLKHSNRIYHIFIASVYAVVVRLSVRPKQVSVPSKRLNVGSHKYRHTIAQRL